MNDFSNLKNSYEDINKTKSITIMMPQKLIDRIRKQLSIMTDKDMSFEDFVAYCCNETLSDLEAFMRTETNTKEN